MSKRNKARAEHKELYDIYEKNGISEGLAKKYHAEVDKKYGQGGGGCLALILSFSMVATSLISQKADMPQFSIDKRKNQNLSAHVEKTATENSPELIL